MVLGCRPSLGDGAGLPPVLGRRSWVTARLWMTVLGYRLSWGTVLGSACRIATVLG
jgi:hypothetical protein